MCAKMSKFVENCRKIAKNENCSKFREISESGDNIFSFRMNNSIQSLPGSSKVDTRGLLLVGNLSAEVSDEKVSSGSGRMGASVKIKLKSETKIEYAPHIFVLIFKL